MPAERRLTMPPVGLPSEAELVRQALAAPEFSPVASPGPRRDGDEEAPDPAAAAELAAAGPAQVLQRWRQGLPAVLARAVAATPQPGATAAGAPVDAGDEAAPHAGREGAQQAEQEAADQEAAEDLDALLTALYTLTGSEASFAAGAMVPLPVVAACVLDPEAVGSEPSDEMLREISGLLPRYDAWLRRLEPYGLVDYRPADPAVLGRATPEGARDSGRRPTGGVGEAAVEDGAEHGAAYGMVRLTPLGRYGLRARLRAAGVAVPLVGELAEEDAVTLLNTLPEYPRHAARAEAERWLDGREPHDAARALLQAARGDDPLAPSRRLACQQVLMLLGPDAAPVLREVLDDRHLGGLARVWLAEHGVDDVPPPDEEMVFWLTVDTLAAQLAADGDSPELQELVRGLVDQHTNFLDRAWRVDHPAAGAVLEAMGRAHQDRDLAKAARRAAFKARSRAAR